ncbi:prenyltransferase/squalene oxidase repeat-containing protein [Pelagicoccus mobilis]|uniref:Terpene cyclase/mutase family protein n=1 Tax=Pelagicoccus mobilis TaxID=415221 RepID=A0A934VKA8_9BACT|nr:prenyltransferase/squalene oxidase repeat-containing protein [Pelagicoccus mobilis]MBK1876471.1 terpene cyclase/mutase family protein [Pelagicoccus mobilis]
MTCSLYLIRTYFVAIGVFLLASQSWLSASETKTSSAPQIVTHSARKPDVSLRNEIDIAINRCLTLLERNQEPSGYWSTSDYPALTALILKAFVESPTDNERWRNSPAVGKALDFIRSNVQEDGGIYSKGLYSYNTAISLMALKSLEDDSLESIMLDARIYLAKQQQLDEWDDNDAVWGGIGYGNSYEHSDLSNTSLAIQALHETRELIGPEQIGIDIDWDAAIRFVENCQNLPEENGQLWASGDPENYGGFVYYPGNSKAGSQNFSNGQVAQRSYGSMSYAGLMSYMYAQLKKDDPRVATAVAWLERNFTLEENPGMGLEGLYYYYYTMAKALDAYGADYLHTEDGQKIDWRKELAETLLSKQRGLGFWQNDNSRWMESDPYIVSAYTILALEILYPKI